MNDDEFKKLYDIDHVKPIARFDLSDSNAQYEVFGWPICCPLLEHQNYSNGDKSNL